VIDRSQGSTPNLAMPVHILVLNYNGRRLLAECLPSIVRAAAASRHPCDLAVIDNDSDDDSVAWLDRHYPQVRVIRHANRGLCSFNDVLAELPGPVSVLLNNDIKLDPGAIDPLVEPLLRTCSEITPQCFSADHHTESDGYNGVAGTISEQVLESHPANDSACFMTAPLCWLFDGQTYEGFKTAVRWRWGLVQATALFEGHQPVIHAPGFTASAGAAIAVDRHKFLQLGGFDPIYLPGRIEDLDFAFRGYAAGYHARYVPQAVAYHRGMSTFGRVFGTAGCDRLALRNTLLFQWKNLRDARSILRQMVGLPIRAAADVIRLPWTAPSRRLAFIKAFASAVARLRQLRATPPASQDRAWFKKGSGTVVRSTRPTFGRCRAVPATVPDPFLNHAQDRRRRAHLFFKEFHPRQVIRRDVSSGPLMESCR
jgi:N-acetylglucosaminyl-diphospho-decaprenol L-rhamnosyltransferase